ncbi:Interactor of constitutive active ROPs 3 [Euphorbia peplus]|nr:Interactor of constitutive active ROPs 3 [Euphorbia peplus]
MQTNKGRNVPSEAPKKLLRPQAARQLKVTAPESDSASSLNQIRTPKERSPQIADRRSPRTPVSEKKRPSRISELEYQVSHLQEELKKAKDQLSLSESWKKEALEDAEESKKQLLAISSKFNESQQKLLVLSDSESDRVVELQTISLDNDHTQQQHSDDAASLAAALDEIQQLKVQLEMVAESEAEQKKNAESTNVELQTLKENLMNTLAHVEDMKSQLIDSKNSEAEAQELARETLHQLETAKKSVEALRSGGSKSTEAYFSIASELEESKARVKLLEEVVSKLETDLRNASDSVNDLYPIARTGLPEEANQLEAEVYSLKSEVERLRCALETAEEKCHEKEDQSSWHIQNAYDLVEQMKSESLLREAKLGAELKQAIADVEELKADLMDKETELQGISEENDDLIMKLRKSLSCQGESELETEFERMKENFSNLKASLMDKETQLQYILEENGALKAELRKKETDKKTGVELEAARAAERDASVKLGLMMEEADRSSKRVARLVEQLEASQVANSEMEADLRRIKVQSDQWRKAAEAAAAMLTSGNNGKFMESNYNHYHEDMDNEMLRKRNGNMLKKIGVLWKKTQI